MKINKITIYIIGLVAVCSLRAMEKPQESLGTMPSEIKTHIFKNLITDDLVTTLKNISSFAQVNKEFNQIINDPQNMKWLIQTLANRIRGKNELSIAQGLKNFPGVQSKEVQEWLKQLNQRIALENELRKAAQNFKTERVAELLKEGVNINAQDPFGRTTVYFLSSSADEYNDILEYFINAGADVNIKTKVGSDPIGIASKYNNVSAVQLLLQANPNLSDVNDALRNVQENSVLSEPNTQAIIKLLEEYIAQQQKAAQVKK